MPDFFAHSGLDAAHFSDWQPLRDHLEAVAAGAQALAKCACPRDPTIAAAAFAAGLLHDLGKYRCEFQSMLKGVSVQREKTYHKQAGAAKAASLKQAPVAFAIAGHHGGIPNKADLESLIKGESGQATCEAIWTQAVVDCAPLAKFALQENRLGGLDADLLTRALFSCLVDADWADTAEHERRTRGKPAEPQPPSFDAPLWLQRVLENIKERAVTCKDPKVGRVRDDVLQECLHAAERPPGLYSLTVPTGGGKTLSGLAFALKHAAVHSDNQNLPLFRRFIYVAPYLSILEQNARVIRGALGLPSHAASVLEHHSLADPPGDEDREETDRAAAARRAENWDAPVVLTTSVQFFESLFSNKPGRCRKLHNIARSVILLDECQTLPPELVAPTCAMLRQLVQQLGCSIVLCTATQPAFDHPALGAEERLGATEIIPPELDLFGRLKRVKIAWPAHKRGALAWPEVAAQMQTERAALCVVNTRRAARELFFELRKSDQGTPIFHLSTTMCPAHRLMVLDQVRDLLKAGEGCYLVSTQLIEAGVDLDFPFVMRELAPLEAIIQAAGRCNREGVLNGPDGSPGGRVVVFRSVEGKLPPDRWYWAGRAVLETNFLNAGRLPRIDEPADIRDYFTRLYHTGKLDEKQIQALRRQFRFADVARAYRLIDDDGAPVVVQTWREGQSQIDVLLSELQESPNRTRFRKLVPYQVQLRRFELAKCGSLLEQVDPRFDLRVWRGEYDSTIGLVEGPGNELLIV
ncbi:MAG: CRISPR-associated endonuclease Cas3'' [Planctomycetes bacterium]|nr:CRISPR-associated endonuclease Cas3'' [Planctomycetota bacterium]